MLEIQDLHVKFHNRDREAVSGVSLTIQDGEFVAIIGRSGAGKSTLLRSVNRMHQITSGTLTVNGTDVSTLSGKSLRRFRRGIGGVGKWNIYTSLSGWIYFEWIWLQNTADCRCKYES